MPKQVKKKKESRNEEGDGRGFFDTSKFSEFENMQNLSWEMWFFWTSDLSFLDFFKKNAVCSHTQKSV